MLKKLRESVNGLIHFFAAIAVLIGLIILQIVGWSSLNKTLALTLFNLGLVLLFAASAAYHMAKANPKVLEILRKLDHVKIFIINAPVQGT